MCWFYSQGICYDAQSYDRKIPRRICLLKQIIEGKIQGKIGAMRRRRGKVRKQLLVET